MYSSSRPLRFMALAVASLALAGCAARNVGSFLERGSDFARYRTYSWAPAAARETGDPRLDNNPFFAERIRADVEKQLAARGFELTASGNPDLLVRYHASIDQRIDLSNIDPGNANCGETDGCRPYVYDAGSLVVDFVDARTDKLVWRGWSEESMDGAIDNQELMEQTIDKAVARILQRLPGRL
jgi:hypothetical protein